MAKNYLPVYPGLGETSINVNYGEMYDTKFYAFCFGQLFKMHRYRNLKKQVGWGLFGNDIDCCYLLS